MIEGATWRVSEAEAGERLDLFLCRKVPDTTRALVQRAIRAGAVTVNRRPAAKGTKLEAGDEVCATRLLQVADLRVRPDPSLPLEILYQDDALLVLNKPPGMPVHPLEPFETGTLANALVARFPDLAAVGGDPLFPALAHRLDRDTSGVIVAARNEAVYACLREAFRAHRVRKEYLALVRGVVNAPGRLEDWLAHDPGRRGRMRVLRDRSEARGERPLRAITEFRPRSRWSRYTLLEVALRTGVTHQIRAQLAAAGTPVAGDTLYGGPAARGELGLSRHFLHASALEFNHPVTGRRLRLEAHLPEDLRHALKNLGPGSPP